MFVSYKWLRELTGTTLSPEEIRERLTNVGLAIDAVEARDADFLLDVEVPSNRGDCLSHVGIARELAVIEESNVQRPKFKIQTAKHLTSRRSQSMILTSVRVTRRELSAARKSRHHRNG